jgi:hypothetical protein
MKVMEGDWREVVDFAVVFWWQAGVAFWRKGCG